MRYVAYLDILGFKETLKKLEHDDAIKYIKDFASLVYNKFSKVEPDRKVKGYIFSDSIILYTTDIKNESLLALIHLIRDICRDEFEVNKVLLRGGLARGTFDKVPASELEALEKGLIVGKAFVEAYILESSAKVIGITISNDVKTDMSRYTMYSNFNNLLRYVDIDFLFKNNNLRDFIKLAFNSNWLPHYYNTLCFAIKNESNNKVEELFHKIREILIVLDSNRDLFSDFLEKGLSEDVEENFKLLIRKYIQNSYRV